MTAVVEEKSYPRMAGVAQVALNSIATSLNVNESRPRSGSMITASYNAAKQTSSNTHFRLSIDLAGQKFEIPMSTGEKTKLPPDSSKILDAWREDNRAKIASDPNRIKYDPEDIPAALDDFQNNYGCNWHNMKGREINKQFESGADALSFVSTMHEPDRRKSIDGQQHLKTMQVINDLRASYLSVIFAQLRKEFPGLNIADFGSSKLTSDRDFAFELGSHNQAKEAQVVERYNQLFKKDWGEDSASANIFDSNAYTMQYLMSASSPEAEGTRSKQQTEGSLMMKLRNSSPESWKEYKEKTLSLMKAAAKNPDLSPEESERLHRAVGNQVKEFIKVERDSKKLDNLLNEEILHQLSDEDSDQVFGDLKGAFEKEGLDTHASIQESLDQIRKLDPSIVKRVEVNASDKLHQKIKQGFKNIENGRFQLLRIRDELSKITDPAKFANGFNKAIDGALNFIQNKSDIGASMATKRLQSNKLDDSPQEAKAMMNAFRDRRALEKEESSVHNKALSLEKCKNELKAAKAQRATVPFGEKQVQLDKKIESLEKEIGQLKHVGEEAKQLESRKNELKESHAEYWEMAASLDDAADMMLIEMQKQNLQGMCFAQEAHVSEGAFAFVVLNIQAKQADVRTMNQYTQAFREISGFYSGHQAKEHTPHEKIIEVSKYADRLMTALDVIKERSAAIGISSPNFGSEMEGQIAKLSTFFKGIAPSRGVGLSSEALLKVTEESAKKSQVADFKEGDHFEMSHLNQINSQVDNISAHLENWIKSMPEEQRNHYYQQAA